MAGAGDNTILVTLVHRVQGLASFASAVNKLQTAQANLTKVNRDYGVEIQKTDARLNEARTRLSALQTAFQKSGTSVNFYATKLAQAQAALSRMDRAHGSYANLLNRITVLEQKRDAALKAGNARSAQALQNLINQLQPVANEYQRLPGIIARLTGEMQKEETRHQSLGARIKTQIARIKELGAALADLTSKQAVAGRAAPGNAAVVFSNIAQGAGLIRSAMKSFAPVVSDATQKTKSFLSNLLQLPRISGLVSKAMNYLGTVVKYTIAILLADAIRTVIQTLKEAAQTAVETVRDFERLNLSLRAMTAQELQAADSTLSIEEALARAAPIAGRTIRWLERLAIISPFSLDEIKNAYLFGQAMGFTTSQAQRVTQAVVDWAAATGRTSEQIERVTYALGQIHTAGRLVGQDILQLAQAGIGVDQILAKAFNKTTAEIREMRIAGLIPANEALEIIISTLEKDWKGAAKNQARSIAGLLSAFQDLSKFMLRDLFGPMDEVSGKVGGVLGVIQDHLGDLVDYMQSAGVREVIRGWGRDLEKMAQNAFVWGRNLIVSFTNGIKSAAMGVVQSLIDIGRVIAYYLRAHSPPKLLPDIDEWGRSALQEYMRGFSDLRGDSFSELEGKMEQFLRSLSLDVLPEIDLVPTILQVREDLAKALSGEISIGSVIGSLGIAGTSLGDYAKSLFDLEFANQAVENAQKKLNEVSKYYEGILEGIRTELQGIENAQSDLLDDQRKRMLSLVMDDPNATLNEKELARLEIERINTEKRLRMTEAEADVAIGAAEDELDAAQANQEQAEKAFELQQRLIDSQIHTNELLQEYLSLLDKLNKEPAGGGAGATEETPLGGGVGLAGLEPGKGDGFGLEEETKRGKAALTPFQQALQELRQVWDAVWARIRETLAPLSEPLTQLKTAWDGLVKAVVDSGPDAKRIFGEVTASIIRMIAQFGPDIIGPVTESIKLIAQLWDQHGDEIMQTLGTLAKFVVAVVLHAMQLAAGAIYLFTVVTTAVLNAWAVLTQLGWDGLWQAIKNVLTVAMANLITKIREKLAAIKVIWDEKVTLLKTKWAEIWDGVKAKIVELLPQVVETVKTKIDEIKTWLGEQITNFTALGTSLIDGITAGVVAAALNLLTAVTGAVGGAIAAAWELIKPGSPSKLTAELIGQPMGEGIAMGIMNSLPTLEGAMQSVLGATIFPVSSGAAALAAGSSSSVTTNYNYSPTYRGSPPSPQRDFAIMQVWSR